MLNKLLGGRYQIVQTLGEGGLAKTYIAEDHHRPGHPKCAVKFLKLANDDPDFLPTARRLFNKEAEILEKLGHHDQIPQSFAYFEEEREFYLVQEFIEGYTLNAELPKGYRWSESKVIEMLRDVLPILEFVHSFGVIHRDITPNNLIRRHQDGRLVLIDFGAVKQVRAPELTTKEMPTQKTICIGTKGYMPTEQLIGRPRLNSDIYALGMIGIQALTGVHPLYLQEDSDGEIIWRERVEVSDELANILTNMVRYHFKDRYQSATEVLKALELASDRFAFARTSLSTRQGKLEVNSEFKSQEMKVELEIDPWTPWNPDSVSEIELWETKVALEHKQSPLHRLLTTVPAVTGVPRSTPELSSDEKEKVNLVFPASSLEPSADLKLNSAPMFVYLKKSRPLIGAGIASILIGIIAGYTYMTHRQSYLQAREALEQIKVLKLDRKYQECVQQAETFPQDYSDLQAEVVHLLYECQQGQAQKQLAGAIKLAEQGRFPEAIALAVRIPVTMKVYSEAQQLISQWSEQIFQIASDRYQEGNLKEAIALVESVPVDSPLATKAKAIIQQWDEEWQQNQTHWQEAQKALDKGLWQDALNAAKKISNTTYWQKQSEPIIQKAEAEIATARSAASRKTYKPRSSSTSSSRSRSVSRSRPTRPLYRLIPRSRPILPRSRSVPRSSPTEWICLNNPNPKCRR